MDKKTIESYKRTVKKMVSLAKTLIKNEIPVIYELGHYLADNVLSKVSMIILAEKKRVDLIFKNGKSGRTVDFPEVSLNLETLPTNEFEPEHGSFYFVPFNKNSILTLEWIEYDPDRYWGVFNSNHPISEIASSISYKPYENLSEKEKFCQSFMHLLDDQRFYNYYKNKENPSNFMKYIAHLYVHLIKIEEDLKNIIPFNVFIKDVGFIEVNNKLLRSWL